MFFTIIRKEMLLNLVSFKFIVSIILLTILIVGSLQIMGVNHGRRLEDYSTAKQMHRSDLANLSSQPQFEAFGVTEDPRPTTLGLFAIGLEKQMSRSFMIPGMTMPGDRGGGRVFFRESKLMSVQPEGSKYANPLFTLFMPPDFIYIINIVLSLLALLFAFDAISGEKEDQTLKLMLTNPIPRDIVIIAKWLGGTLSILIPFILAFGVGFLLVSIRKDISFAGEDYTRIAILFTLSALYISVFYLMGLLFSAFSQKSSTALILSLFAWVVFVLVVPNISPVIAKRLVPTVTADQVIREEEKLETDLTHEAWKSEGDERRNISDRIKKEVPQRVRDLEGRWLNRLDNQTKLAMNISRISPSATYVYAATTIAGTGVKDYAQLREEIYRHREELGKERDHFVRPDKSKPIPMLYIKIKMEKVPLFRNMHLDLTNSLNNAIWDIGILCIYLVILFMVTFVKFLRYDVK